MKKARPHWLQYELGDELNKLRFDLSYKSKKIVSCKESQVVAAEIIRTCREKIREDSTIESESPRKKKLLRFEL